MAADKNVILIYNSFFGSRGSGNNQFDYPAGICFVNDKLYIVDKQNHRIKIHETDGTFVSSFGSFGTGNDNFSFPEFIVSDGVSLFITDSANHRIKEHDLNGAFVSEFGTRGAGSGQFDYPTGITIYDDNLWIADKQNNRAKAHTKAGAFLLEITGLNFPEGVASINDTIVVTNSATRELKFYTPLGSFLNNSPYNFNYPYQVKNVGGVLAVSEKQISSLVFLDEVGNFITSFGTEGSGLNQFLFPYDFAVNDTIDQIFITDSGNHKIVNYDYTIEDDVPIFADRFLRLTKRLYPTGRAWWMKKEGTFEKFHLGLAYSESRAYSAHVDLLNSIIPDNDQFSEQDAVNWEQALGLLTPQNVTLEQRKDVILRKMAFPESVPARQHYLFIQGELQKAGFDVYVHENRFGDPPVVLPLTATNYGTFNYGAANYGTSGFANITRIANHLEEEKDENYSFGNEINLRATFFIGGEIFPNRAIVDPDLKKQFRELILKLKPAQTAGILLIDYVKQVGIGFDAIPTPIY